ncbi:hypothetical protein NE237_013356 [Protea cynaroides]|uniref:Uncharacterized protein n=1 Tax=Protea cynaroides TaxID=273540 RepID=A0A9Q0H1J3_9MAGN|nr:hypothetical protein NE237_013356 [Protea cynaroides]
MVLKNPLYRLSNGVTMLTPVAKCLSSRYQGRRPYLVKASLGNAEELKVRKSKPVFVCPTAKTYDGFYYFLPFDEALTTGPLGIFFSFEMDGKRIENLFETIKQALAKALAHFNPLAGRFKQHPDGKFMLKCTGGVSFFKAVANCDLREFGDFTIANLPKQRQLIYACSKAKNYFNIPLFAVQVIYTYVKFSFQKFEF